jgi:hypothetical protein
VRPVPVLDTCKQLLHPSQFIEGKPPIDLSQLAQALILTFAVEELPKNQLTGIIKSLNLSILNLTTWERKEKKNENNLTPDWYFKTGVTPHNFISLLQSQNFSPLLTT